MMRYFFLGFLLVALPLQAQQTPQVLGYGVKGCDNYNEVFEGWGERTGRSDRGVYSLPRLAGRTGYRFVAGNRE